MKSHVPEERKNDIAIKLECGSVAGLLGQTFTYPLDVVRRQMQILQVQRLSASNSHEMKGTVDTLVMMVRTHGWKQLFFGLSLNYLKPSDAASGPVSQMNARSYGGSNCGN